MGGITALLVLGVLYPFFPGNYDSLAMALSTMIQAFGLLGLLLVPVGVVWLASEIRTQAQSKRHLPVQARRSVFAVVSMIAASVFALALTFVAVAVSGLFLGLLTIVLWLYLVSRLIPGLRALKSTESERVHPAPLYLIFIPLAVFVAQLAFAAPVTEFSRNAAMEQSTELINAIETYHTRHGRYPASLSAVWKDYSSPGVGAEKYQYAPSGETYNLFFEQPRFLLDNFGTREFVVYNPRDEQTMISHTSWILLFSPDELESMQGWYAVHNAPRPHWKYFWFD